MASEVIGHHTHRYEVIKNWGEQEPAKYPVNDCHEMVVDRRGRIYMLTNETRNNILIYNVNGRLLGHWGNSYPGAHGLSITDEGDEQFLFITDTDRHQVIKTTLDGREVMVIDYPKEIPAYQSAEQFKPTETAPNGDIYITDGYGLQYVIQYNNKGQYIRHWGGRGDAPEQFNCVHGIAVDNRNPSQLTLIITSRNHNAFKRFTLDGQYLETIYLPGSFVCRPVIQGDFLYAAVFRSGTNTNFGSGYITILDKDFKVISTPGGTEPQYIDGLLQEQKQDKPVFIHPHDVCPYGDDLIVCQWNAEKTYPVKLKRVYQEAV